MNTFNENWFYLQKCSFKNGNFLCGHDSNDEMISEWSWAGRHFWFDNFYAMKTLKWKISGWLVFDKFEADWYGSKKNDM